MTENDAYPLSPEDVGLRATPPEQTYLDSDYEEVWIGPRWDIGAGQGRYSLYLKGNYALTVNSLDLACRIVQDDLGTPFAKGDYSKEAS